MSAKAKKPLVPRLRFAEFLNEEAWSERKLGEIGNFVGGGTPSTSNPKYWDGNIQWYTPKEIKNRMLKPSMRTISKDGLKNSSAKLLPKGTILITTRATIGDVAIANKECATNQGFQSLVVNETEVNLFWYYWILLHKNELIKRSSGSTFKEIRKTKIAVIPAFSPKRKEQQKIAACLTALDDLISAATGRLDALKQHKQGLMQQLFPAEGETVPRLRFAEFRDAGEWESKKLDDNDVSSFVKKRLPLSGIARENYVSTENILPDFGGITTVAKMPPSGSFTAYRRGDILIANIRPYLKKIWVANRNGGASNDIIVVRSKRNNSFLSFILKNEVFINYVMQGAKGVKMPRGDIKLIKRYPISVPELKEQKKIAACLAALDDLIAAQTQKIAKLKTYKRGLMQQLFPAVDETH